MHLSHRSGAARRQKVLSLRIVPGRDEKTTAALCADAHEFSLHAWVRCGAHQRKELERPCRYITRPAIANERLKRTDAGDVVPQLKSAWRDGTTHIKMSPLEFMQRLAALVPRPRLHLTFLFRRHRYKTVISGTRTYEEQDRLPDAAQRRLLLISHLP
jgi:hypothetical protein